MAETEPRERLQPALLDRLVREGDAGRVISKAELKQAVLRDLSWLFNAVQPHPEWQETHPTLAATVLNYGMPPMAGLQASKVDVSQLERTIADVIRNYEPRIRPETLTVRALEVQSVLETHNVIEFEIHCEIWAIPVPIEILLRTKLDLEAGQVEVREALGASTPGAVRGPA